MKRTVEELLYTHNDKILTEEDRANIKEIFIQTLTDTTTKNYFQILSLYMHARRKKNLTSIDVSRISGVPEITIARFENLQSVPQAITLMKILEAVDLKISVIEKSE